eukprot:scaffold184017_cov29-Tisochrysis_lutea.AAC.3
MSTFSSRATGRSALSIAMAGDVRHASYCGNGDHLLRNTRYIVLSSPVPPLSDGKMIPLSASGTCE